MSWETALRRRLLSSAPVAALAGARVDWDRRTQGAPLPAVVLQTIGDDRDQHYGGFQSFRRTRVQIDCFAKSAPEKVALREAVIAAVAAGGMFDGVRFGRATDIQISGHSDNTTTDFIHGDSIDLSIWHT